MRRIGRIGKGRRKRKEVRFHPTTAGGIAIHHRRTVRRQNRRDLRRKPRQGGSIGGVVQPLQTRRGGNGGAVSGGNIGRQRRPQGSHVPSHVPKGEGYRQTHRRSSVDGGTSHRFRGGSLSPRPRLGAVHPRSDPGRRHDHPGRFGNAAENRSHLGHGTEAILLAVHLSAQLRRRDGTRGHAGTEGGGTRQFGRTGVDPDVARRGGFSVHDSRGEFGHGEQRVEFHGERVRRVFGADGCRRADQKSRGGDCHGDVVGG
mmetsp:Transcript_37530/g.63920  ORF Transcript_37530/g.63920 Transcript_37530/m.63920 type:complete len:258 (-) Transcript_37530:109-882(-)